MMDAEFKSTFGKPDIRSISESVSMKLLNSTPGATIHHAIGFGTFADGFISIASVREEAFLAGWCRWLPETAYVYASSCFGILYLAVGDEMWLLNSQTGSIMPTGYPLDEAIFKAADPAVMDGLLNLDVFREWQAEGNCLLADQFLSPSPPLIFGGAMAPFSLKPVQAEEYLRSTAAMFDDTGRNAVSIMGPDD